MKALRFSAFGGPELLRWEDVPAPEPGPGEVLIEVRAVSVNPVDAKIRSGELARIFRVEPPAVSGRDGAGVVLAAGAGVEHPRPGTRVFFVAARNAGTAAERLVLPAAKAVEAPANLSLEAAAAVPLAAMSAWAGLVDTARVEAGMRVLVHGGAGGVGGMAVQLARHLGASVTATCSAANVDYVLGLGAETAIAYDREDFAARCRDIDVVFDPIGGEVHRRSYPVLRRGGTLAWLAAAPVEDRSAEYGVASRMVMVRDDPSALAAIARLVEAGALRPQIDAVLPVSQAAAAHRRIESGHGRGKIVLTLG